MNSVVKAYNQPPYYDDFNVEDVNQQGLNVFTKNYHRILFQPTYAVQTRELNQLQTILQNQIGQLATSQINAYYGGTVLGGGTNHEDNIRFMDVKFTNADVANVYQNIKYIESRDIVGDAASVKYTAEVFSIAPQSDGETFRVWFKYLNIEDKDQGVGKKDFLSTDRIYIKGNTIPETGVADDDPVIDIGQNGLQTDYQIMSIVPKSDLENNDISIGWGLSISTEEGVFLIKGCMVHSFPQKYYYAKTNKTETVNAFISFLIEETVVTAEQDPTLRDNANGTYNYAAPGADRYTIKLTLALNTKDPQILELNAGINPIFNGIDNQDQTLQFINLREIIESIVKNAAGAGSESDTLEDAQNLRTYEESGNYTVRPFLCNAREFLDEDGNNGRYKIEVILQNDTTAGQDIKQLYYDETGDDIRSLTPDNAGDPAVDGFKEWLRGKLALDIDSSIAYISGKRVEPGGVRTVLIPKARGDITIGKRKYSHERDAIGVNVSMPRGNYVDVVVDPANTNAADIDGMFSVTGASTLGQNIKAIEYLGPIAANDLEYNAPAEPDQTDPTPTRANWLKFRLYVYNDFDNASGDLSSDLPAGFKFRYLPSSLYGTSPSPIPDASIKSPRNNSSVYPLGYKAVKSVTSLEYSILEYFAPQNESQSVDRQYIFSLSSSKVFINGLNRLNIVLYNHTQGNYVDALNEIEVFDISDPYELKIIIKSGSLQVNPTTDQLSLIAPVSINEDNTSNFRRSKTIATVANESITVKCSNGIGVLANQDVIFNTLTASCNGNPVSFTIFDDGFHENFYDNPVIKFDITADPAQPNATSTVNVSYKYFQHTDASTSKHYFTVDSYPIFVTGLEDPADHIKYEDIPKYRDSRLSDYIDFRVKRQKSYDINTETFSYTYLETSEPIPIIPNAIGEFNFTHYLPRIDHLLLDTGTNFNINYGKPDINPFPPLPPAKTSMVLYEIVLLPYTYDEKDIRKGYIDNSRYTMRDIGALEKRISNLEYYTSLSLLEKEAQDRKILDLSAEGAGAERFKNGVLVDSFVSHDVGDISNPDYSAAVNTKLRTMGPKYNVYNHRCKYTGIVDDTLIINTTNPPSNITKNLSGDIVDGHILIAPITDGYSPGFIGDKQICLDTGVREILYENLAATQTISVQPYEVAVWSGRVTLKPSSDEWIDTEHAGNRAVDLSAFENFAKTSAEYIIDIYGTDETIISDTLVGSVTTSTQETVARDGHGFVTTTTNTTVDTYNQQFSTEWLSSSMQNFEIDFGPRVVDTSVIPFIRSRDIYFVGEGFLPNTKLYAFFDKIEVTPYCADFTIGTVSGYGHSNNVLTYNDQDLANWGNTFDGDLVTDEFGRIEGVFRIPNIDTTDKTLQFRCGVREFKLTNNPFNVDLEADTFGSTSYNADGLKQSIETSISSIELPQIEYNIDYSDRLVTRTSQTQTQQTHDPIAQTFEIGAEYPAGVFLTDVDVYFAEVPEDPTTPITGYLVTCVNGTPTRTIVPGSEKTLLSGEIDNVTGRYINDGVIDYGQLAEDPITNYPTRFTFNYPVYLEPQTEYAFVLFSQVPTFRVWISDLTQVDLVTNRPVSNNSGFGVLQKSQNKRTWTAYQTQDLMMRMYKAVFTPGDVHEFKFSTYVLNANAGAYPVTSNVSGVSGSAQDVNSYKHTFIQPFFKTLEIPLTNIDFEINYKTLAGTVSGHGVGEFALLKAGQEVFLKREIDSPGMIEVTARLTTFNRDVTPMIDCETTSLHCKETLVNDPLSDPSIGVLNEGATYAYDSEYQEYRWTNPSSSGGNALAKYITKKVVLNNPAADLRVILAVNRPSFGCNIKVYAKRKPTEAFEKSMRQEVDWYEMAVYSVNNDTNAKEIPILTNKSDFTEVEYILPYPDPNYVDDAIDPVLGFTEFTTKVVFTAKDSAQVCKIKDLRAIASF